jgi:hypothetical protein
VPFLFPLFLTNFLLGYEINPEAMAFIKSVPPPIGIVGVAGMYRTGKSYLLNRMILNRSDGFGVGPTINPCTKVFPLISFKFISS